MGETYTVGGNNEQTNIQVVASICQQLTQLVPNHQLASSNGFSSLIQHITDRPGHDRRYAIDASKLTTTLHWTPKHNFSDGLRQTVQWYLAHYQ